MEPTARGFTAAGEATTGMSAQLPGSKQLLPALRCMGAQASSHLPLHYWLDGGRRVEHPMHGSEVLGALNLTASTELPIPSLLSRLLPSTTAATQPERKTCRARDLERSAVLDTSARVGSPRGRTNGVAGRQGDLADITGTGRLSAYIAARLPRPLFLARHSNSRGPYDPVFDHQNPNPVINRAASTRQATRMETAASSSGLSGPASSSSSPPRREPLGRPKPTKSNSSKSTKTPVATHSSVLAPLAARLGLRTPTAASIAKGVAAPAPKQAPLGGIARGPPPRSNSTLGTEEGRPASAASVAAPGYDLPSLAGDNAALPGMSASPPLASFSGNAQHSSTEPSEESDLGPYSTGNETEPGGVGNNESITTALRFTEHSEDRVFSGLACSLEVFREPLMTSVARYH
ncbi:hypothetical protein DFH08DRAFT_823926 [Mycena albidolilacea]|uniref:Uncharacterized protein n=1 Tax=Mycena albidolilacea TaxID=1033008 RepID=A0AAD6Z5X6_9AGAR|nr:hypothetical protein DFH08DRAFT_823926 [Mycena albidolilacea]